MDGNGNSSLIRTITVVGAVVAFLGFQLALFSQISDMREGIARLEGDVARIDGDVQDL